MVGGVPGFLIAEVGGDVIGTLNTLDLVAGIPARVWLLTSQGCMHKFPRCFEGLFYEPVDWCCVTLAPLKKITLGQMHRAAMMMHMWRAYAYSGRHRKGVAAPCRLRRISRMMTIRNETGTVVEIPICVGQSKASQTLILDLSHRVLKSLVCITRRCSSSSVLSFHTGSRHYFFPSRMMSL